MGLILQGYYSLAWGIVSTLNKIARFGMLRGVVRFVVAERTQGEGDGDPAVGTVVHRSPMLSWSKRRNLLQCRCNRLVLQQADCLRAADYGLPLRSWRFAGVVSAIRALRIVLYDV